MADVYFLSQLVESMDEHVDRLENARNKGDKAKVENIKNMIFHLYEQIDAILMGKKRQDVKGT
ncbi:MAG: hypothetical protein ACP5D2_00585 [Candidatus Nanoarchaeia archaeon]